ncbi:hypothetical protein SAMN05518871_108126 [Psychrobacillus sp. OK028]|uniref:hypothetical protein n=1 Tax=Psychrobacillus sp. OK028 TaxID=1884359 RepID=UPI0008910567|nr:hypothetical protein [Psychrobacillus sp. OK028]SDN89493.1 hypothetical protein SAMN05518871_108126 [Psychrobacillus sp. OK028]
MNNQFPFPQNPEGSQGFPSIEGQQFGGQQFPGSMMPPFGQQQFPGNMFPPFGNSQFPGFPPFGQQQGPSFPPSFPSGGQQQGGAPTSPPPSFVPQRQNASVFAVDPGSIRGCLFRFTYVWLNNGNAFWLYPTHVGRRSVSGFRWNGFRWTYYGTDLERISSFQCF